MSLSGPSRAMLLDAVVAALAGAGTLAGDRVFKRRWMPLIEAQCPGILVSAPMELKRSQSAALCGPATYFTEVSIALSLRTVAKATASGGAAADALLDQLCAQVEDVLATAPGILALIQGFGDVHTQYAVSAEGAPVLGEASIVAQYTLFQQFQPDGGIPLTDVAGFDDPGFAPAHQLFDAPIPQDG